MTQEGVFPVKVFPIDSLCSSATSVSFQSGAQWFLLCCPAPHSHPMICAISGQSLVFVMPCLCHSFLYHGHHGPTVSFLMNTQRINYMLGVY